MGNSKIMDADKVVTATFVAVPLTYYTLTLGLVGSGVITPGVGAHSYLSGTVVDLSASPADGWQFVDWMGDVASDVNPAQVTLDASKAVTATFTELAAPPTYTLAVHTVGQGQVTQAPSQTTYLSGDVVTLTAIPMTGWYFGQWSGDASGTLTQTMVTMNADKVVTATFVAVPPTYYTLTLGLVGSGVITPGVGAHSYLSGRVVDLSASPTAGWQFTGWSGDFESSANPTQITLDADKAVAATFTLKAENAAPVANAGVAQTVAPSVGFTLDGSASSDPDGHLPLTYGWTQVGGPAVSFTATVSRTTFTAPETPTVLTFTLTVTDSLGLADWTPDTVVITVAPYTIHLPLVIRNQ